MEEYKLWDEWRPTVDEIIDWEALKQFMMKLSKEQLIVFGYGLVESIITEVSAVIVAKDLEG